MMLIISSWTYSSTSKRFSKQKLSKGGKGNSRINLPNFVIFSSLSKAYSFFKFETQLMKARSEGLSIKGNLVKSCIHIALSSKVISMISLLNISGILYSLRFSKDYLVKSL